MKKLYLYFLFLVVSVVLTSCSKNTDNANAANSCNWTLNFDSQQYSWTGTYPSTGTNDGQAAYTGTSGSAPNGNMSLASPTIGGVRAQLMTATFLSVATGTFQMDQFSYNQTTFIGNTFSIVFNSSEIYSTQFPGSNVVFTITDLSPNTFLNSGLSGAGYVKGSFTGTICNLNGDSHPINGTFSSIRLQ